MREGLVDKLRERLAYIQHTLSPDAEDTDWAYWTGKREEHARLKPLHEKMLAVVGALAGGEPDYNSAWSMICLMAEGEGNDASVYQQMAKAIHAKLKPAMDELERSVE